MRIPLLALLLLTNAAAALASGRAMTPGQATGHRGQLVTVSGVVSSLGGRPDGITLRVGPEPSLPVTIPAAVRRTLSTDPAQWIGRTVEVTGFVSPAREPLELRIAHAGQLSLPAASGGAEVDALRHRVAVLEGEVNRLTPRLVAEARSAVVVGSTRPATAVALPLASTQTTVLAHLGVPSRVEWGQTRRVMYYGRERWTFDTEGQLVDVRRN